MYRRMPQKPKRKVANRTAAEAHAKQADDAQVSAMRAIEQAFLDVLASKYGAISSASSYNSKLQRIKGHFFRREYAKVFNDAQACLIYALRYMPSRALAYARLFAEPPLLDLLYPKSAMSENTTRPVKITAVGAGVGSELCALHLARSIRAATSHATTSDDEDGESEMCDADRFSRPLELDIVDYAEYAEFLNDLQETGIATSEDANSVRHHYHQKSVLTWAQEPEFASLLGRTDLLTFMFVFNELFVESKAGTMKLIAACVANLQIGAHVLLVESAGDLSEVQVGESTAMVYKFWDHLPQFERVMSIDRRWYRIDKQLKYDLELENVAYFARLYRKVR